MSKDAPRYAELMDHINFTHPRHETSDSKGNRIKVPFGVCDTAVGDLCCHSRGKKEGSEEDVDTTVTECARQIGLGPTLFLMSTKAMAYLFLVLGILNLPVLFFFYSGNATQSDSTYA